VNVYKEQLSSNIMNEQDNENKLYELKEFKGYKITKNGQIWSEKSNRFLQSKLCNGYHTIGMRKMESTVHRLVAQTFIPNPDNKPYVNHKDSDKTNNKVENLEWVTQKENCALHNKVISHVRKVIQMDKEGKVLNTFDSLIKAGEHIGFSASAISKAVLGINPSAGGFLWAYDDTDQHTIAKDTSKGKQIYEYVKYYIFPDGTVYNNVRKANVKPVKNASGYTYVTISNNKTKKNYYVHRLVAEHFIENKENKTQVNHKNKIRDDNRIENLEWVTPSENILHAKSSVPSL
jgi:hypothetical protein